MRQHLLMSAMPFYRWRTFIVLFALALAGCGPSHIERMQIAGPPLGATVPTLKDAIAVGQVSGGSSYVNRAGVTDGEFKEVLENVLRSSGVLAPTSAAARWRLDAGLNFNDAASGWAFTDQQIDTTITYRLYSQSGGDPVFARVVTTSATKPSDTGAQVLMFVLGGVGGLDGDVTVRRRSAYEATVRQNLGQLLAQLGEWGQGNAPAVAVVPAVRQVLPQPLIAGIAPASTRASAAAGPPTAPSQPPQPVPSSELVAAAPATRVTPPAEARRDPAMFGDIVEFRCPTERTEIAFRSGTARVFAGADGTSCRYESAGGALPITAFGTDATAAAYLQQLWPLSVGKEASFSTATTNAGSSTATQETYRVVGHELITVAAGSFDCFVIERDATINAYRTRSFEHSKYWYAPEVGYVVKMVTETRGKSDPQVSDDEAVRIVSR